MVAIAYLFDRDKLVISRYIKKIFESNELDYNLTVTKNITVQIEGKRKISREIIYNNLDVIIAVGYIVNSKRETMFRKWANRELREYLIKGYAINENRMVVSNENYIELRNAVVNINNRLIKKEDKVFDKKYDLK